MKEKLYTVMVSGMFEGDPEIKVFVFYNYNDALGVFNSQVKDIKDACAESRSENPIDVSHGEPDDDELEGRYVFDLTEYGNGSKDFRIWSHGYFIEDHQVIILKEVDPHGTSNSQLKKAQI